MTHNEPFSIIRLAHDLDCDLCVFNGLPFAEACLATVEVPADLVTPIAGWIRQIRTLAGEFLSTTDCDYLAHCSAELQSYLSVLHPAGDKEFWRAVEVGHYTIDGRLMTDDDFEAAWDEAFA